MKDLMPMISRREASFCFAMHSLARLSRFTSLLQVILCSKINLIFCLGKHGAAKIRVIGIDIFTDRKYDDLLTADEQVVSPVVKKIDYQLVTILDDNYVQLQADGIAREDLRLDPAEDFVDALITKFDQGEDVSVTTVACLGVEKITGFRILKA